MDDRRGGDPLVIPLTLDEMEPNPLRHPSAPTRASRPIGDCVLLCGGLYPAPLTRAAGRSLLDLPVGPDKTLIDHWDERLEESGVFDQVGRVVMLHSREVAAPHPRIEHAARFADRIEPDAFRGPAGAVRDTVGLGEGDEFVLVLEANRYQNEPLERFVQLSAEDDVDVVIASNADHTPAGGYLIRRRVLAEVPPVGFMDIKEQLIGRAIDGGGRVEIAQFEGVGSVRVRTRRDLLAAVGLEAGRTGRVQGPMDWAARPMVLANTGWASVVCTGAEVNEGAVLVESVVMGDGRVGDGAVVVRSVVCPGAEVGPGAEVVDAVVTPDGVRYDADEAVVRFRSKQQGYRGRS